MSGGMMNGNKLLPSSPPSRGGGIYTLALECLARYQKAAVAEAREREDEPGRIQRRKEQQRPYLAVCR